MDLLILTFIDLNFDINIILYFLLINDNTILKVLMTYIVSKTIYSNSNIFKIIRQVVVLFLFYLNMNLEFLNSILILIFTIQFFLSVNPLTHPSIVI